MNLIPLFSYFTLFAQAGIVVLFVLFCLRIIFKKDTYIKKISDAIASQAVLLAFVVASGATLGSLYLSEVRGFAPCVLCWYQRSFMYPQVVVLGLGLMMNDPKAKIYALALSVVGFGIAFYHVLLQFFPEAFKCSDEVASCSAKQFASFGYITIPVMSLTAFTLIILLLLFTFIRKK